MFPFTLPCSPETNFKTLYFSYPQVLLNLPRQNQSDRLCESISYIFHHPTLVAKKKTSFHKLKHIFNPTNPEIPNNSPPLPPHPPWIQDVSPINTNLPVSKQRGKIPAFTDSECFSKRCDSENSTETLGSSGEVVPPTPHRITKGGRFMWGAVEGFFVEELGGLYEKFGDGRTWYIWFDVTSIFFWLGFTYIYLIYLCSSSCSPVFHQKYSPWQILSLWTSRFGPLNPKTSLVCGHFESPRLPSHCSLPTGKGPCCQGKQSLHGV